MRIATKTIAACAISICTSGLFAQNIQAEPLKNVAQLSASGSVEVQQDLLLMSLVTSRDGLDASTVQSQLRQALDTALGQARQAAVPDLMAVRTGNFSLYPRYGKDGKINGWQGSTELILEGKDFPRITGTAGKILTLSLGGVSFALSREQRARVEGEAQTQAIERFKAKAGEISAAFGFGGHTVREVSFSANDQGPRPRAMAMSARSDMAEAPVPVEAGKSTVQVVVSGSVQMTQPLARP
ncbi:MAG: SIMPL domain-containing protein [Polaromonas sp.]|nr:SIMPL domain-containing protein [Polaromonas sp.]